MGVVDVAADWIKRARKAKADADERSRCLREAERLAHCASDWTTIAYEWVEIDPPREADARRCVVSAFACEDHDAHTYREAASIVGRKLGDLQGARDVLRRCQTFLTTREDTRASEWPGLAGAFVRVLDDRAAARECLELGLARTASPDCGALCTFAASYAEDVGDADTARALIVRAEALVEATCEDWWTLANAYRHALADPEAAWRILERGLARADTVARCVRISRAIASHAERDPTRTALVLAALAKAEELSTTPGDWLVVADEYHEARADLALVRRCLDHALSADADGKARVQIARGHRHLLGDPARADEIAPRGTAPGAIVVCHRRLENWEAQPAQLLDWLRARITSKSLHAIAKADWGMGYDKHLAALVDIQSTGLIPQPLQWHPGEVLELTRWKEGAATDHVARAFACTVLCINVCGPEYKDGLAPTVAVLIESCLALGDDALSAAVGLLVTMVEAHEDWRSDHAFALLGLLLVAAARNPHDERLVALSERLVEIERERQQNGYRRPKWGWLLGLESFDVRHALWRSLAEGVLAPAAGDPALAHLAAIAARLRPG